MKNLPSRRFWVGLLFAIVPVHIFYACLDYVRVGYLLWYNPEDMSFGETYISAMIGHLVSFGIPLPFSYIIAPFSFSVLYVVKWRRMLKLNRISSIWGSILAVYFFLIFDIFEFMMAEAGSPKDLALDRNIYLLAALLLGPIFIGAILTWTLRTAVWVEHSEPV